MAIASRMIIRHQWLLNNCRILAFPRRVQIKPQKTTRLQQPRPSVAAMVIRPSEEMHFILGVVGLDIWLHWRRHAHAGKKDSITEKAGGLHQAHVVGAACCHLPCQHGMSPGPKQDDFISSGMRPSVWGHHSYPCLIHSWEWVRKDPQSLQTQVQGRDNLGLNPGFTTYKRGALDGDP